MEILNQFGINPILLAAQVVNFLILLFILKKFLYGPILKVLDTRKKTIEQSLKNAEEIERRLQQTQEDSEKIIAKTLKESQKILDQTNKAGALMLEDYNKTGAEILQKASENALKFNEVERGKLKQEIKENLGGLVVLIIEKVIGKKISKEDQNELIEKEIKNIS